MTQKAHFITRAALLAALYAVLSWMQNLLLPGSSTWAIQFRIAEALCVLAFFTPAAIVGVSLGCLVFNLSHIGALPLDFLVGTLGSFLAASAMWLTRKLTVKGFPLLGLCMPALFNGLLVGWELDLFVGGGFWLHAAYVALGELAVLLTLGAGLYYVMKVWRLDRRLFRRFR